MDEPTSTVTTAAPSTATSSTATGGGAAAATTSTATPSPATERGASSGTTKTAPVESPEREALRRLRGGESPTAIQKDLQGRGAQQQTADAAKPAAGAKPAQQQRQTQKDGATVDATATTNAAGQADGAEQHGLDEKDLNALKRAKFDLTLLKHMPASNRKAIARQFATSQAEADRQFQLARSGKNPVTGEPATSTDPANPNATHADGTTGAGTDPNNKGGGAQASAPTQTADATAAAASSPFAPFKVADADLATLKDIGGEEFANVTGKLLQQQAGHYHQQLTQLGGLIGHIFGRFEEQDFRDGVSSLREQPGFENLGEKELTAIRERAGVLVNAAANPYSYGLKEAVADAAASLFRVNTTQAVQAKLATARAASVSGSPDRGQTTAQPNTRPLSETDRMKAVLRNLRKGMGAGEARAAADLDRAA